MALQNAFRNQLLARFGKNVWVYSLVERACVGDLHLKSSHGGHGMRADYPNKARPRNFYAFLTGELSHQRLEPQNANRRRRVFIYI